MVDIGTKATPGSSTEHTTSNLSQRSCATADEGGASHSGVPPNARRGEGDEVERAWTKTKKKPSQFSSLHCLSHSSDYSREHTEAHRLVTTVPPLASAHFLVDPEPAGFARVGLDGARVVGTNEGRGAVVGTRDVRLTSRGGGGAWRDEARRCVGGAIVSAVTTDERGPAMRSGAVAIDFLGFDDDDVAAIRSVKVVGFNPRPRGSLLSVGIAVDDRDLAIPVRSPAVRRFPTEFDRRSPPPRASSGIAAVTSGGEFDRLNKSSSRCFRSDLILSKRARVVSFRSPGVLGGCTSSITEGAACREPEGVAVGARELRGARLVIGVEEIRAGVVVDFEARQGAGVSNEINLPTAGWFPIATPFSDLDRPSAGPPKLDLPRTVDLGRDCDGRASGV